jgi:hypothetical protein
MIFVSKVQDLVRIRSRVAMRDVVLWRFSRLSNAESQLIFRGLTARHGGHDMLQVPPGDGGPSRTSGVQRVGNSIRPRVIV